MSPARLRVPQDATFPETSLHVMGIGSEYPEQTCNAREFKDFALRHYPRTPALEKVLMINENTGIDTRSTMSIDNPLLNQAHAPTIDELSAFFLREGVRLATAAARKAIAEWGGDVSDITHVVAVTCTNSANPGYDYYVARELGLSYTVDRTLLHGVGCAGGLAALRTAANLALGAAFLGLQARVLVVACELSSLMARSELDSLSADQDLRIGVTIFSDGASALVLSNGIGGVQEAKPLYDLLAWDHVTVPDTDREIGFDVHPNGWKVVLTPKVPTLAATSAPQLFKSLVARVPAVQAKDAAAFDWALHPGGAKVLTGCQKTLGISPEHLRASYDVYKKHGNSSSATVFSVLNRLREMGPGREHVVGCAFGPGVAVEMCVLRKAEGLSYMHDDVAGTSASSSDSE